MFLEDWKRILETEFSPHVDIHGNVIYPIKTQSQWVMYNHYCFCAIREEEEIERTQLTEEEIKELCDFWKHSKKQTKKDNVYLCIFQEKDEYKIMAYYRDKIKDIGNIKGDRSQ
jgi:hypothetical protein